MSNKSNLIITPETSLKALVAALDQALASLDVASEHFVATVLNTDELVDDIKRLDDPEKVRELMLLLENYVLMSGFLVDNPLITVIRQIRQESKLKESDPPVMAINAHIEKGQVWTHYKGTTYEIVSVARNANLPNILEIHYADQAGKVWSLPIHEFTKTVTHEGKEVYRFNYEY